MSNVWDEMQNLSEEENVEKIENSDECLYLLFIVGANIYAIDCKNVVSIEKFDDNRVIQIVGSDPASCMRGVINHQGTAIGLIGLRKLFGIRSALEEHNVDLNIPQRIKDHENWINKLEESVKTRTEFTLTHDPTKCAFGRWLRTFQTSNNVILQVLRKIDEPHKKVHDTATKVKKLMMSDNQEEALNTIKEVKENEYKKTIDALISLERALLESMHEIVIVVKEKSGMVGLVVDDTINIEHLTPVKSSSVSLQNVVDFIGQRDERFLMENKTVASNNIAFILNSQKLYNKVASDDEKDMGEE